jgi:DNA segregation ATPase FtsK/SpoIIIE-like protein
VYQDMSEAELVAAAAAEAATRRRQLLADGAAPDEAAAAAAVGEVSAAERPGRRCAASEVTPEQRAKVSLHLEQHEARQRAVLQHARLGSMSIASVLGSGAAPGAMASSTASASAAAAAAAGGRTSLTVPTYFHVISGKRPNSTVEASQELLLQQLQALNSAYGPHGIRFELRGITRVQSEAWAVAEINSPEESLLKARLRK